MKRLLSVLLALMLVIGCIFALSACGDEEETSVAETSVAETASSEPETSKTGTTLTETYKGETLTYEKGAISFAYPADWTFTDGSIPQMIDVETGNNINLVTETLTDDTREVYAELDTEYYNNSLKPAYEAMGYSVGSATVEKITNQNGVALASLSYSMTYSGVEMDMVQIFCMDDTDCYIITYTGVTDSSFLNTLINSVTFG